MTLKEALDRVRQDPGDQRAWGVIEEALWKLARTITDKDCLLSRSVPVVLDKLQDQALCGDLEVIEYPASYLRRRLNWRIIDLVRKGDRDKALRDRIPKPVPPEPVPIPLHGDLLRDLELVFERAVTRRDAWQQDHLVRAWGQIKRLLLEDVTLRALLVEEEGLGPSDAEACKRAVVRAYKAHERTRQALREALEDLVGRGKFDAERGARVREALTRLKRRQDRKPPHVSKDRGDGR